MTRTEWEEEFDVMIARASADLNDEQFAMWQNHIQNQSMKYSNKRIGGAKPPYMDFGRKKKVQDDSAGHVYISKDHCKVFDDCIRTYGMELQTDIAMEEMGELIQALVKYRRALNRLVYGQGITESDKEKMEEAQLNVTEELGDVIIMVSQLLMMYGNATEVQKSIQYKVTRAKNRLKEYKILTGYQEEGHDVSTSDCTLSIRSGS